MSKWVLDTFQGVKTWYSSDVIDKIVSVCEEHICDNESCDYPECECLPRAVLEIIEKEDKSEERQNGN